MQYRLLGNSGLRVSEASLGTMTFGEDWGWGTAKDESRKVYDAFREAGGNFIDTANLYTNGSSETFLGEFMKGHRESVVLATKFSNALPGKDPNAAGNHRKSMVQAVEGSLKRLQTGYIDLYWVHIWDGLTPVEEVMRGLDDLVRQGKVLYVGISDAPAWWVAQANMLAQLRGWSPFAGGVLTGKYHGHGSSEQARLSSDMLKDFRPDQQRADRVVAAVKKVSDEVGRSMAQVALAWLRHRAVPVIPILGARKLTQLQDNLASFDLALSPEHVKILDDASPVDLGFPQELYAKEFPRALRYGGMRDQIAA